MQSVPDGDNEALLEGVIRQYFLPEELEEARVLLAQNGYEAAIAFLVQRGRETLRQSGKSPDGQITGSPFYLTLPNGNILVRHPDTPAESLRSTLTLRLSDLARLAFPLVEAEGWRGISSAGTRPGLPFLWPDMENASALPVEQGRVTATPKGARHCPRLVYLEEDIDSGQGTVIRRVRGYVIKGRGLGYAVQPLRQPGYLLNVIHLKSRQVIASLYLDEYNETASERIRAMMSSVVELCDWNQGMRAILKDRSRREWERIIEAIWQRERRRPRLLSLFTRIGEDS